MAVSMDINTCRYLYWALANNQMSSTAELFLSYWIILCKTAWYEHNYKNVEKQQIVGLYDNETF